jgi:exonuclease SbcC
VRLERLRLVNFRQHEDTELVFGAGLTGIIGANGAGKTTLLEAVAWALYGTDAARGNRDTIRRRNAGPRSPVRVELDFVLGAHRFRVIRSLNGAELYQDAEVAPRENGIGAVTEKITRILGMSREEFFNTYFTGQKQLAVMAAMKPTERAQFLSRVLGYEKLRLAQDRLRETRLTVRATLQALESSLPDPAELDEAETRARTRLADAEKLELTSSKALELTDRRRNEMAPRWQELQQQREKVASLESDLRLAEHRVNAARESFAQLDRQLVAANEARSRLDGLKAQLAPLEALRAERARLDELAAAHAKRQVALAQLEEARSALTNVRQRLSKLPPADEVEAARAKVEEQRARLEVIDESYRERRSAWDRDLQDAKTKRAALRDQYKDLKEQLDRITEAGPQGACPTCARPLGSEYDNVLGVLDRQLQDVMFNGNYFKARVEQLTVEPPELGDLDRQRIAGDKALSDATTTLARLTALAQEGPALRTEQTRLEARAADLEKQAAEGPKDYDPNHHAEVRKQLHALDPLALQAERLRAASEKAEALVTEAEAAEKALSELEHAARATREQLAALGYRQEDYEAARKNWETVERERREAELNLIKVKAEKGAAGEAVEAVLARRAERARREESARKAARELALYNELDRAFTDLRTDLNQQLRPDLSELASGFLRDLTNGRYTELELDEDYIATIVEAGEPKPVISGGEEDIASLALRLAISQMIADRAGQPLSLLVLDEVFGSLDEERRASVLDLLRSLADRFPQVILITHIESVREGFDRVVRVDYDAERGAARVRDEPQGVSDGLAA